MKKVVLMIVLALAFVACSRAQKPEVAAKEIIDSMNKSDYATIWDKYIPDTDKAIVAKNVEDLKKDERSLLLLQPLGIDNSNIQTITPKEMYIKMTQFFNDLLKENVKDNVTIVKIEQKDNDAIVFTKQGDLEGEITLSKQNGKWYLVNKSEEEMAPETKEKMQEAPADIK